MSIIRPLDRTRKGSEERVRRVLADRKPHRWKELLNATRMSSRCLRETLKGMESKGLTYRRVETSEEYPPPVVYGLTKNGVKNTMPLIFAAHGAFYIAGLDLGDPDGWGISGNKDIALTIGRDFPSKEPVEMIAEIGRRIGALHLYALLKAFEEKDREWFEETTRHATLLLPIVLHRCVEREMAATEPTSSKRRGKEISARDDRIFSGVKKEVIQKLRDLLRRIYPADMEEFDQVPEEYEDLSAKGYRFIVPLQSGMCKLETLTIPNHRSSKSRKHPRETPQPEKSPR